jgi:hypothetical protein
LRPMTDAELAMRGELLVGPSTIEGAGLGLFSVQRIAKGVKLGAYTGVCLDRKPSDVSATQYLLNATNNATCRFIDGDYVRHPDRASLFSLMNTARAADINVEFTNKGNVVTRRVIQPGEELFVSYGKEFQLPAKGKPRPRPEVEPKLVVAKDPVEILHTIWRLSGGSVDKALTQRQFKSVYSRLMLLFALGGRALDLVPRWRAGAEYTEHDTDLVIERIVAAAGEGLPQSCVLLPGNQLKAEGTLLMEDYVCVGAMFGPEDDDLVVVDLNLYTTPLLSMPMQLLHVLPTETRVVTSSKWPLPLTAAKVTMWLRVNTKTMPRIATHSHSLSLSLSKKVRDLWTIQRAAYVTFSEITAQPTMTANVVPSPNKLWPSSQITDTEVLALMGLLGREPPVQVLNMAWVPTPDPSSAYITVLLSWPPQQEPDPPSMNATIHLYTSPSTQGLRGWFLASEVWRNASVSEHWAPQVNNLSRFRGPQGDVVFAITLSGQLDTNSMLDSIPAQLSNPPPAQPIDYTRMRDYVMTMKRNMPPEDVARLPPHLEDSFFARWHSCSGYGVYSHVPILEGAFLGHYTGRVVPKAAPDSWYVWALFDDAHPGDSYIDGNYTQVPEAGYLSLFNTSASSESANVLATLERDASGKTVRAYYTKRQIRPKEELLVYYGEEYVELIKAGYAAMDLELRHALRWTASFLSSAQACGIEWMQDADAVADALVLHPRILENGIRRVGMSWLPTSMASVPASVFHLMGTSQLDATPAVQPTTHAILEAVVDKIRSRIRQCIGSFNTFYDLRTSIATTPDLLDLLDLPGLPAKVISLDTLPSLVFSNPIETTPLISQKCMQLAGRSPMPFDVNPLWVSISPRAGMSLASIELNLRITIELIYAIIQKKIKGVRVVRPAALFKANASDIVEENVLGAVPVGRQQNEELNAFVGKTIEALVRKRVSLASVSLPTSFTFKVLPANEVIVFSLFPTVTTSPSRS